MFYLIEVTNYNNDTAESKAIYSYQTEDEAVSKWHTKMGGAMSNETYDTELLIVVNSVGAVIRSDYWQRNHTEE